MASGTEAPSRRRRRTPTVARAEIVDAARSALRDRGESGFTVASVMAHTDMSRKTFYVHFADLGEVIVELVRPLRAELDAALDAWRTADDTERAGDAALDAAAAIYIENSTLLRAVWRAQPDPDVERARRALTEPLVAAGADILRDRRGLAPAEARAIAEALATMNVHALLDLGEHPGAERARQTTSALRAVWRRVVLTH